MKPNELKNITENLLETFISAGRKSLELRNEGLKTVIKSDGSPVTNADIEVDKLIKKEITKLTPDIPLISEETVNLKKNNKFKDFWLIDPIDGTKDYIANKDEFTLNAALIINLKPIIGIINVPAKNKLFYSYGHGFAFEKNIQDTKNLNSNKNNIYQTKLFQ